MTIAAEIVSKSPFCPDSEIASRQQFGTSFPNPTKPANESHKHKNGTYTRAAEEYYASQHNIELHNQFAYKPKRLKVFTIGAGFSGLLVAHKFQHRFPEMKDIVDHTIFEARKDIGGTWLVNHYPGVQCDVPAHIYVSGLWHEMSERC